DYLIEVQIRSSDIFAQRAAFDKFRRDEVAAVLLAKVVNGDDMRMVEGAGGTGFALQPTHSLRAVKAGRQKFQRGVSPQSRVISEVNRAHPTATEFPDQAVVPDHFAAETLGTIIVTEH